MDPFDPRFPSDPMQKKFARLEAQRAAQEAAQRAAAEAARLAADRPQGFGLVVTSDPQYPWRDRNKDSVTVSVVPPGVGEDFDWKAFAETQIREQYANVNALAQARSGAGEPFPIKGVVINGDLTAFGHGDELDKHKDTVKTLTPKLYPSLGNHDYANNVDDCANNGCARDMVLYMYDWLKANASSVSYDFAAADSYKGELRTDFSGSLAYSFNVGKVHFVNLQNYPSYARSWNSWIADKARRYFFDIKPSFDWLANDLASARNRGDAIVVFIHDVGDSFADAKEKDNVVTRYGTNVKRFSDLAVKYGVAAVFAGHIHPDCGRVVLPSLAGLDLGIPFYRCGAACYQNYLLLDVDTRHNKMTVRKMQRPYGGSYAATDLGTIPLDVTVPNPPLPVPPAKGYVTFFNEGGYVAKFHLSYVYEGQAQSFDTGNMNLGNKRTFDIPPSATSVRVWAEEKTGLAWNPWKKVFDETHAVPPNRCYKVYGTTLNPHWNNDC